MGNTLSPQAQAQHAAVHRLFDQVTTNKPDSHKGIKLDDSGNVTQIVAPNMEGQLNNEIMSNLGTLLPHLRKLVLNDHLLSGPCSLDVLPPKLVELVLARADVEEPIGEGLTGTLDASKLPHTLETFNVQGNSFSGTIEWAALSYLGSLSVFWLGSRAGNCACGGDVAFHHLPRSLTNLSIQNCSFSGTADLRGLPEGMQKICLDGNPNLLFVGDVDDFPLGPDDWNKENYKKMSVMLGSGVDAAVVDGDEFMWLVVAQREGGNMQHAAVRRLFGQVIKNKHKSWTAENSISKWEGITLDEKGNIIKIDFRMAMVHGQLNNDVMNTLGTLLPHLKVLDLTGHMLSGPCSLDALPPQLEALGLERDKKELGEGLTGTLDASKMPATLESVNLQGNSFSGPIDWPSLSKCTSLKTLWLADNRFDGTPQLQHLPCSLEYFSIAGCNFSGTANVSELPSGITELRLDGNRNLELVGDVAKFPLGLEGGCKEELGRLSITLHSGTADPTVVNGDRFYRYVLQAHDQRLLRRAVPESDANRAADAERRVADLENRIRELEKQNEQIQKAFLVANDAQSARADAQSARADAEAARAAGLERELKLSQEENRRLEAQIERLGDLVQQDGAASVPVSGVLTAVALPATGGPAPAGPTLDQVAASQQEASTVSQPSTGSRATTRSINGSDGGADLAAAIGAHFPDLVRNNNADVVHEMQQQQSNR